MPQLENFVFRPALVVILTNGFLKNQTDTELNNKLIYLSFCSNPTKREDDQDIQEKHHEETSLLKWYSDFNADVASFSIRMAKVKTNLTKPENHVQSCAKKTPRPGQIAEPSFALELSLA